ncbi:hypothetical protein [Nocardia australiensis]|uniref:hypothetical protein n=1 Tax=Nocardia australiensis TaxID=2887191 RepID=UPI001D13A9E2|nr:hypothetical protein [Nocardia australiensis]
MNPINAPYGETVEVLRATRDRVGDRSDAVHHSIEGCVFWSGSDAGAAVQEDDQRRDTSTVHANLAIPRSADLLGTDRIRRTDQSVYTVVGGPQWDQLHPMTGWDTGFKIVKLKGVF